MNKFKKVLKTEFFNKFVARNNSSESGYWWIVPIDVQEEIASPIEVWEWIEENFKMV